MKIIYEPHPVSLERKKELRAKGYKILDERFAPAGYKHPDAEPEAPRRGRPPKAALEGDE